MHETIICKKIIEQAKKAGCSKSVHVEVGELTELSPEEVEETLKHMAEWNVKVSFQKSEVKCNCSYAGEAKIIDKGHGYCYFKCPKCGENPKVLKGGEIKIIGVE